MANFTITLFHEQNIVLHWTEVFKNVAEALGHLARGIVVLGAVYYGYRSMRRDDAAAQAGREPGGENAGGAGEGGGGPVVEMRAVPKPGRQQLAHQIQASVERQLGETTMIPKNPNGVLADNLNPVNDPGVEAPSPGEAPAPQLVE